METCEVLIIGAGPAGSTCARLLARAGLSVLLMDRHQFPRGKACAGWITPEVLETLRIDPELYSQGRLLQEIREFRTGIMFDRVEIVTDYGKTVSYGIRRCEFDHFLLQRCGARTMLGQAVQSLERQRDGWLVNGNIRARLVIGAGGHSCPVARVLGAKPRQEQAIVAMVAEFEMDEAQLAKCPVPAGHAALLFTGDGKGYGWLLRKGPFLNVGLGSLQSMQLRRRLSDFCTHLQERGHLEGALAMRFLGHAYLPFRSHGGRRIVADHALLIGDAAGVSFPESGEGILPAVESGLMAAQAVLFAAGDYCADRLAPYAAAVAARYAGKAADAGALAVPPGIKRLGAKALLSSPWLTRHLVLDRWFLHRGQRLLVP